MPDLPVGDAVASFVDYLVANWSGLFDGISQALLTMVRLVYVALAGLHPAALTAVLVTVALVAIRRWQAPVAFLAAFLLVQSMGLWVQTIQTLSIVVVASIVAMLVGVPLGIIAAQSNRTRILVRPVLDFMQTLPVFVYLLTAVFFFGIGVVPGVVATTVFAVPPAVRLTELGIRQVDTETVEAARAFGAKPLQTLREVQLPLAMPSIMAGVNQVIMLALSMVVIAGMVGGGGLGEVVVQSVTQLDIGRGFEGGLSVVILAIYLDRVTAALGQGHRRPRLRRLAISQRSPVGAGRA